MFWVGLFLFLPTLNHNRQQKPTRWKSPSASKRLHTTYNLCVLYSFKVCEELCRLLEELSFWPDIYPNVIFCSQTGVENAVTRWRKNSKLVLVSLLVTGLLLAALLVAGYYFKTHRKNSKGVRLVSILEGKRCFRLLLHNEKNTTALSKQVHTLL